MCPKRDGKILKDTEKDCYLGFENPFTGIKFKQTQTNRDFLTEEELHAIMEKKFDIPRLEAVRDIFVFCCLSGLAFTDVQHLKPEHITKDINGEWWIRKGENQQCVSYSPIGHSGNDHREI